MQATYIVFSALLFVAPSTSMAAPTPEKIIVVPDTGGSPLDVEIKGPAVLVERLKQCQQPQFRGGNNGIAVNWGDGPTVPNNSNNYKGKNCKDFYTHAYTKYGTYNITIQLSKAGPTDGIEMQWLGTATVTVKSGM